MWCWWLPPMLIPAALGILALYWYNPPGLDWMSFDERQDRDDDRGD